MMTDKKNKNNNIKIIITGDFCPVNRTEKIFLQKKYNLVYNDVHSLLLDNDLSITNLECPLTKHHNPISKSGPNLIADPLNILGIKYGGFNIVALANNHIFDQDETGLNDTINICKQHEIYTVGAGSNLYEASKPLIVEIKDKKIAILNFAESEFGIASKNKPGANPLDPISNYYQIQQAKSKADYVFVIIHGGHEYYSLPSPRMKKTYRFFAELGVSAVVGHHTHCASGFEIYNDVPIFYSVGNFIFDWPGRKEISWNEGFFINFDINKIGRLKFELVPYHQNNSDPGLQLMQGVKKEHFLKTLDVLSTIISNDEQLESEWNKFSKTREAGYFYRLVSPNKIIQKLARKKIFRDLYIDDKFLLKVLNMIHCQSHRDLLIESLERKTDKGRK